MSEMYREICDTYFQTQPVITGDTAITENGAHVDHTEDSKQDTIRTTSFTVTKTNGEQTGTYIPPGSEISRNVTSEPLFGAHNRVSENPITVIGYSPRSGTFTSGALYSGAVLACFIFYCLIVYGYRSQISSLFASVSWKSKPETSLAGTNYFFDHFVKFFWLLGFLVFGLAMLRYLDLNVAVTYLEQLPWYLILAGSICILLLPFLVWTMQWVIVKVAGAITKLPELASKIVRLKMLMYALGGLLITPLALFYCTSQTVTGQTIGLILVTAFSLLMIYTYTSIYFLFRDRKISIFYWFLYLCAIEIVPVTFPLVLALRTYNL